MISCIAVDDEPLALQVIKEYCENDSLILLHALVTFRRLFNDIAGADLFIQGMTITSLCVRLFKIQILEA